MTAQKIIATLTFIWMAFQLSAQSGSLYFPPKTGNFWATTPAVELGFCPDRIDSLYQFLARTNTKGFLLLHDGRIVLEKYFGTFVQDSVWYWASAGKTATAFLVGQAQERGKLKLSDPTSKFLGNGWTTCPPDKEALITVRHQITMTSGLDDTGAWASANPDCKDPSCLKYKADAGTRWAYHNPPYLLIHNVLEKAVGQNINLITKNYLFDDTGMKGLWVNGVFFSTPRSMARFGLLLQAKGSWDGKPLLADQQYFQEMTNSSQNMNLSYGYLTWLNGKNSFMMPASQFVFPQKLMPGAPDDVFAGLGKDDQKLYVVPSKGWVVVRMGKDGGNAQNLPVPILYDRELWQYLNDLECTSSVDAPFFNDKSNIKIAPNPARDGWQISANSDIDRVEMFDLHGILLQNQVGNQQNSLFLPRRNLQSGIYFIKIWIGNQCSTQRILAN